HRDQLDHVTCNPLSMEMCSMVRIPPPKMRGSMAQWCPTSACFWQMWGFPTLFSGRNSPRRSYGHRSFRKLLKACGSRLYGSGWLPEAVTSAGSGCHFRGVFTPDEMRRYSRMLCVSIGNRNILCISWFKPAQMFLAEHLWISSE